MKREELIDELLIILNSLTVLKDESFAVYALEKLIECIKNEQKSP